MKRFLKTLMATALLTVGAGVAHSFADEHEVNDIWWNLDNDYNRSNQTACVAENYNDYPVDAVFDIFPATFDFYGNPMPSRTVVTLRPNEQYKVFGWANVTGPGPQCALRSYTVAIP